MLRKSSIFVILFCISIIACSCFYSTPPIAVEDPLPSLDISTPNPTSGWGPNVLEVYFVDVGQGDCTIYRYNGEKNLIIDAGSGSKTEELIAYIKKIGIKHFDIVIATHPDEDHIGGLDNVINTFGADKVYAPKITKDTVAFSNFAAAVKNQGIRINAPDAGEVFYLGTVPFTVIAPNKTQYSETNNYSIVTHVVDGKYSFLNMGDAAFESEKEILSKGYSVRSNVIKIGHHGSSTSTSRNFFLSVNPDYSVISVGKDNKYGHPSQETLDTISTSKLFRTDKDGTIIFNTDGSTLWRN